MTLQEAIAKLPWPTDLVSVSEKDSLDGTVVVLAQRRRCPFSTRPFVTWEFGPRVGLFSGHYDLTPEQGWKDFERRYSD